MPLLGELAAFLPQLKLLSKVQREFHFPFGECHRSFSIRFRAPVFYRRLHCTFLRDLFEEFPQRLLYTHTRMLCSTTSSTQYIVHQPSNHIPSKPSQIICTQSLPEKRGLPFLYLLEQRRNLILKKWEEKNFVGTRVRTEDLWDGRRTLYQGTTWSIF